VAGDWMMIDLELSDKPEVHQIAAILKIDPDEVVGKLLRVWSWFDKQTIDGHAPSVTHAVLDRLSARDGFAEAMAKAGWLDRSDSGLRMPKFERWNGQSAKKRALANRRQAKKRNADVTLPSRTKRDKNVTREEKIKLTTPLPPSGAFLRFWGTWPKSTRKQAQGQCWDRWRKADLDQGAEKIIAHVEGLKGSADWRKNGGEFIPAPLVYLNQRRWEGAEAPAPAQEAPLYRREGVM
jgi:hypothetical protein